MFGLPSAVRIYLAVEPVDMRNGFDGLSAIVHARGQDVFSGHLFVFLSKRRDRAKILTWDRGGFVLWYKRLERGRFRRPAATLSNAGAISLDATELTMLLDGIDLSRVRRLNPWRPTPRPAAGGIDNRPVL